MSPSLRVELELVPPFSLSGGDCGCTGQETWCCLALLVIKEGVSPGPEQERLLRKGGELRATHHKLSLQMYKGSEEDACHDDTVPPF